MTKKTGILLEVIEHNGPVNGDCKVEPYCRVKIDSQGFPYIVAQHQKWVISSTEFPQKLNFFDDTWATITKCIKGKEELLNILANPMLTTNKLSMGQLMRVSHV